MFSHPQALISIDMGLSPAGGGAGRCPAADPGCAADVGRALLDYLGPRLGAGPLAFTEPPREIPHGWETYVYRFRVRAAGALPPAFNRPLVLRVYASPQGVPRSAHEVAVQRHLHRRGRSVAEPLLAEDDCERFGGPFQVMELVPGETLLDRLRRDNALIFQIARQLGEEHLRLHRLPVDGFPAPPGGFLDRRLGELEGRIRAHGLDGLRAGLAWLHAHRPPPPEAPVILHLDFHPTNIMVAEGRPAAVLDWSEADVGDRHADVATTVALIHTAPVRGMNLYEQLIAPLVRSLLIRGYLGGYRRQAPLDLNRLRYYLACAALRRLGVCGMWLRAGPQANGCKPSSLRYLRSGHVESLQERFHHWTGVGARVDV